MWFGETNIPHLSTRLPLGVQGVEWIDDDRLMLASDRAKADQPFICTVRDQSVHIMVRAPFVGGLHLVWWRCLRLALHVNVEKHRSMRFRW